MGEHGVSILFVEIGRSIAEIRWQVRHVMKSLLAEFDILMNVAGFKSVEEIDRNALGKHFQTVIASKVF